MAIGNISTYEVSKTVFIGRRKTEAFFFFLEKKKMVEFQKDIDKRYNLKIIKKRKTRY